MVDHPVLVAGGGIAGLAAALSLARQGESTILLEREPRFSEVGAGLQLGPNAVAALRAIGAWDAVEPITSQPPEIHMRDGRDQGALLFADWIDLHHEGYVIVNFEPVGHGFTQNRGRERSE